MHKRPERPRITSAQNPRIKAALKLRERRDRRESGLMLVEGFHELSLAFDSGRLQIQTLFLCPELVRWGEEVLAERIAALDIEIIEVDAPVIEKLGYRENPDAWLAVARVPGFSLEDLDRSRAAAPVGSDLFIVAENLEKPGNLGAILRSADAVGVSGILVCSGRTDVFNPNVVRASKGSLFTVPVVECTNHAAWEWLERKRIPVLAATPEGSASHWDADLKSPVAIAVGAEKEGLSAFWMERASLKVRIPMRGNVNSLNVAQATTLLLYEALRQRR